MRHLGRHMLNIAMLYVSKVSAIVVGILVLPEFNHLLGPQQFGIVAVILSVQSLLLMLDLGMSTLVGRDVAASGAGLMDGSQSWRTSNFVITAFYVAMAPAAWLLNSIFEEPLTGLQLAGCMVMFWGLTLQNVGQIALMAAHRFATASGIQLVGVLARAVVTLAALRMFGTDLSVFVTAQALCVVLQWCCTHIACRRLFTITTSHLDEIPALIAQAMAMLKRGGPLVLFGVAGASVMQLDKPLVSAMTSAAQTAPYYLATVLCLTPLSTLAGPVAQFFQPRVTRAVSSHDDDAIHQSLALFTTALVLITFVPSAFLWLLREQIIDLWLGNAANSPKVSIYTGILLPGAAIGALGYLPYSILVARQDFRFQAMASTCMTLVTLAAAAACAHRGSIEGVCWVYACYHSMSTTVSWLRCIWLDRGGIRHAIVALLRASALASAVIIPALVLALSANFQ